MTFELGLATWIGTAALGLIAAAYLAALLMPAVVLDRDREGKMKNDRHYISGGHVFCPVRREDTDIESCFTCASLKDVNVLASPPFIVCDPPRASSLATEADSLYLAWRLQHHRRIAR